MLFPGVNQKMHVLDFLKILQEIKKWRENLEMKYGEQTDKICINHFSSDQYYDPKSSSQSVRLFSTAIPHPVTIIVSYLHCL